MALLSTSALLLTLVLAFIQPSAVELVKSSLQQAIFSLYFSAAFSALTLVFVAIFAGEEETGFLRRIPLRFFLTLLLVTQ